LNILLSGASGFVGAHLRQTLEARGHQVASLGRGSNSDFNWSEESLRAGVASVDGIVHLAGENLFARRWSAAQKEVLRKSRIETTARLANLAAELKKDFLIQASAVGYYGPSAAPGLTEEAPPADDFVAQLCVDWEAANQPARDAGVRVAWVRTGVVLGVEGGALQRMLTPFKLGLGGPIGNGKQGFPWIHVQDLANLFCFLVETPGSSGAYNGTAPGGLSMGAFAKCLGRVLKRPAILPVPGFALRILLGEAACILTTGQLPIPERAQQAGFVFEHPEVEPALRELLGKP